MNKPSLNGSFQRALTLTLGVAALHLTAASMPAFASQALPTPAALLPQHLGGMLGFLGSSEGNQDSKLKDTIRKKLADAGATDVPLEPAQGDFQEKVRDANPSANVLSLLRTYAPLPDAWSNVAGTAFDDVRVSDEEALALGVLGSEGSRAVLTNNNGAAYDAEGHVFYFWGGGGGSYGGNEVYRLDLQSVAAEQVSAPSALTQTMKGADGTSCLVPGDGPAAGTSYDGIVWAQTTQTFFVFPADQFCPSAAVSPQSIWEFNPSAGTWIEAASLGTLQAPVVAEYDRATDKIWIVTPGSTARLREFDPLTGTLSAGRDLGFSLQSVGSAVMREATGELLLLAKEGIYAIPVANPATAQRLADVPNEVDPRAGLTFDPTTARLVLWSGGTEVRTFAPSAAQWQTFTPPSGPAGTSKAVLSKWVFIPEVSLFAGYQDPAEGLWLYRLPANLPGVESSNRAPVADAGPDASAPIRSTFGLFGSNSFDPDQDNLTFAWQIVRKPTGSIASLASLASATASQSSLVPDVEGEYVLRLTVSDGALIDTDTLRIAAVNTAPQANAGTDRRADLGTSLTLDGSGSFDSNQDALTYTWTLISQPAGSATTIQNASAAKPSIMLDALGAFVLQLVVSDGIVNSAADTMRITVAEKESTGAIGNPGDLLELSQMAPARGAWRLVPNTAFDLVRLSFREAEAFGVAGSSGSVSVLLSWNGAAFDQENHTMYFYGGGHGNYNGNEVYSLNFETLELKRRNDPAPLTDRTSAPGTCLPATGPGAGHTYNGTTWSPATNTVIQFTNMASKTSDPACGSHWNNWIAAFDPRTNQWSRLSANSAQVSGDTLNQAIAYPQCAASTKTGLIYCLNSQGRGNMHVFDPLKGKVVCRSQRTTDRWLISGATHYRDGYLYYGHDGIWRIPVDTLDGSNCEFTSEEQVTTAIQGLTPDFGFAFRGNEIYAWDGDSRIWRWVMGESTHWTTINPAGTGPTYYTWDNGGQTIGKVFDKWVYLPELDVFAGYQNPREGLWLYSPPTAAQVESAANAAKAEAQALGYKCSDDVGGWTCPNLQEAVNATPAGGTLTLKKGIYNQCAVIKKRITLDGNGSLIKNVTCMGKGTLILTGLSAAGVGGADQSTIMNLECRDVFRCVRREVPSLTLKNVYFHHGSNGLQGYGIDAYVGTVTIEDSTFSHFGKDGLHHAVYIPRVDQLIIRRSKFLCSKHGDHEVKSGARKTVIEDTLIDGQDCIDSRAVDTYNGGELIIRRSTIVEGLNSENRDMIGYNWEKRVQFPVARVEITDTAFVCNKTAAVIKWGTPGPSSVIFRNNTLTGSCTNVPQ